MKKHSKMKTIIGFSAVLILCIFFFYLCILFQNPTFFKSVYRATPTNEGKEILIPVPKLSYFKTECCEFFATFTSFRSKASLTKEINDYLLRLEKMSCYDETYYYDKKQDLSITTYRVDRSNFLLNTITLSYTKGRYCPEEEKN